MSEVQKIS